MKIYDPYRACRKEQSVSKKIRHDVRKNRALFFRPSFLSPDLYFLMDQDIIETLKQSTRCTHHHLFEPKNTTVAQYTPCPGLLLNCIPIDDYVTKCYPSSFQPVCILEVKTLAIICWKTFGTEISKAAEVVAVCREDSVNIFFQLGLNLISA